MLTSSYPRSIDAAATPANYPENLFTLLGGRYSVNAYETLTAMCPIGICDDARHVVPRSGGLGGLARDGLDLWQEFASPRRAEPGLNIARGTFALDPEPLATAKSFVDSLEPTREPELDFLHVFLPHWPWRYVGAAAEDTGDRGNPPGLKNDRWTSAWSAQSGRARHLLQVQATDSVLGSIMTRLRSIGAWDDSLVVVTADHGVGFEPGDPPRGLSRADAPDLLWTPLFIKLPQQTVARVDDRPARTVDILPTVVDVLGVKMPWNPSGVSLLGPPRPDGPVRVVHWPLDDVAPTDGRFNRVDGPTGFRAVLGRRATAEPDAAHAFYRIGRYRDLVGAAAAPLIGANRSSYRGSITDPARFAAVVPDAPVAPWLRIGGAVAPADHPVDLAVTVNGVVGAVTRSVRGASASVAPWWGDLPPDLFRSGPNDVRVYEISGPPASPQLLPLG